MPPARWLSRWLSTICLAWTVFAAADAGAQLTTSGNSFTVTGVEVDVTAQDALKAREQGIREAQGKAAKLLIDRMVARETGQFDDALRYYERSLGLMQRLANQGGMADAWRMIGRTFLVQQRYDLCDHRHFRQCHRCASKSNRCAGRLHLR